MAQLRPGHPDYICPPSEYAPRPSESATKLQRYHREAFATKDDGVYQPVSSEDPPPSYSTT
jgi:hypothetical protein